MPGAMTRRYPKNRMSSSAYGANLGLRSSLPRATRHVQLEKAIAQEEEDSMRVEVMVVTTQQDAWPPMAPRQVESTAPQVCQRPSLQGREFLEGQTVSSSNPTSSHSARTRRRKASTSTWLDAEVTPQNHQESSRLGTRHSGQEVLWSLQSTEEHQRNNSDQIAMLQNQSLGQQRLITSLVQALGQSKCDPAKMDGANQHQPEV